MELCSILCGSLDGRVVSGRMDTCICIAGSLCCSPDTTTALLISYIPIQSKKLKKKIHQAQYPQHLHVAAYGKITFFCIAK